MKVFVWEEIENCTSCYHSEGGLVVFAESEQRARELAEDRGAKISPEEKPDEIRIVNGGEEAVYVMPNAGCC